MGSLSLKLIIYFIIIMIKILITTLVRNNEQWLPIFYSEVDKLKEEFKNKIEFTIFIYENDSIDSTKSLLKGDFFSHNYGHPGDMVSRTRRLAFYRNNLKELSSSSEYDFVLMVDSNILFSPSALQSLLGTLDTREDVAMACSHGLVQTSLPCHFFYDTFATITPDGQKCGQFTNVVECAYPGPYHDRHCHHAHGSPPLYGGATGLVELNSCFGGFVLIRNEVYMKCEWGITNPSDCEHWEFCSQVRKHGKIVLDRGARVLWSE
jgi:hypothetical protein